MDMIQFPLKFDSTGLKKLPEGSYEYYSQLLSISILTEPLTHPMTPQFGSYDPVFRTIDKGLFILNAARYVPEIRIIDISTSESIDSKVNISFSFEIERQ
jgi:hypothetical protein